jgi:hypothetical protein
MGRSLADERHHGIYSTPDDLAFSMQQGPDRDFAFHTLGWYQFQSLAVSILSDVLGQTVEAGAAGRDAGIDAMFRGTWIKAAGEEYSGRFIAQAKYSRYAARSLNLNVLAGEIPKLEALVKAGKCDHYLIFTNHTASFENKLMIEEELRNRTGVKTATVYGPDRLTQWIRESSRLRMMVPRVYGLGDLTEIIDERARQQAKAVLESFQSRLQTVVPTDAYRKAARALDEHHFVLLIGDPMTGKTTISYALALAALDNLQLDVFLVKSPEEFRDHWNPEAPKRFFWVDDVFGQTQLDRAVTFEWNREFDRLQAAVDRGAKFVFTTRTYIWNDARYLTKRSAFPLIDNSQVRIYVEDLTKVEKRQILYHHVRMGNQPTQFKAAIHPHLEALTDIKSFLPEAARRVGNSFFTKAIPIPPTAASLKDFFERPLEILVEIIEQLDRDSTALLAVMFARGGSLPAPLALIDSDREVIELVGSTPERVAASVATLNENLIRRVVDFEGNGSYVFTHPTVRDALATITGKNPDMLRIYLAGVEVKAALQEVSCGNVQLPGVRVIVPPAEFESFFSKFRRYSVAREGFEVAEPLEFLATRCVKRFLELVLEGYSEVLERPLHIQWGSTSSDPWLVLMGRLNEFDLLSDVLREEAVSRMLRASDEEISFTLEPSLMNLFTETERWDCLQAIRTRFIPALADAIEAQARDYEPGDGAIPEYFSELTDYCDTAKKLFANDEVTFELLEQAELRINSCIEQLEEEYPEPDPDRDHDDYDLEEPAEPSDGDSDVFQDVADPN